jgi:hypothetical protein
MVVRWQATGVIVCGAMIACGLDLGGTGEMSDASASPTDATVPQSDGPGVEGDSAEADAVGDGAPTMETSSPLDATAEADAPLEAAKDTGIDAAPDALPQKYVCPGGGTTSDCAAGCPGYPLRCVMCGSGGALYATCTPYGVSCYANYKPSQYDWCRCSSGHAASCILPEQECNPYAGGVCVTCGENSTDTYPCKQGGRCNEFARICQ